MKHCYWCTNQRCQRYHMEIQSDFSPSAALQATGRHISCSACGQTMRWLRSFTATPKEILNSHE